MKVVTDNSLADKDTLKKKKKTKPAKIYVDGESLEPITKKKKDVLNSNIERRKIIHLHPETHSLDDPDYRVVASNDIQEEFMMEDFDEETDQHYVCRHSTAEQKKKKSKLQSEKNSNENNKTISCTDGCLGDCNLVRDLRSGIRKWPFEKP